MKIRIHALALALLSFCAAVFAAEPSGTLPVMTVETENHKPIDSKDTYVSATYTLDPRGCEGVEAFSGELQIRGRGNYTWWGGFVKKPYRVKLAQKTPLLGMKKSKHFGLLAHADDNLGFLRTPLGFRLAEMTGMDWTPAMQPVELVVNGDYRGLYFLTELIRVDKDRVNVVDQEDDPVQDPTGGWLCEIDNYEEIAAEQLKLTDGSGNRLWVTHKSPEVLNAEQESFLRSQYTAMDKAVYANDLASTEWEKYIDKKSIAQMYIVYELLDNFEGFNGSCYMHRQRGADEKWKFGPVWDFGQVYQRPVGKFIHEDSGFDWCNRTWIPQLVKKTSFEAEYKALFKEFVTPENVAAIEAYLDDFAAKIAAAAVCDADRYERPGAMEQTNRDVAAGLRAIKNNLRRRIAFLSAAFGIPVDIEGPSGLYLRGEVNNWNAVDDWEFVRTGANTYELYDKKLSGTFKIADASWGPHNWGGLAASSMTTVLPDMSARLACGLDYNDLRTSKADTYPLIRFEINEAFSTATLTLFTAASVEGVSTGGKTSITVSGGTVSSADGSALTVFDPAGRIVSAGKPSVSLPAGAYIVRAADGSALKALIR